LTSSHENTGRADDTRSPGEPSDNVYRSPAAEGDAPVMPGMLFRWEIGALVCKAVALYLLVQGLLIGGSMLAMLAGLLVVNRLDAGRVESYAVGVLFPVVQFLVGLLLWSMAESVGRRMVPGEPGPVIRTNLDAKSLMNVAFATVGLCLTVVNFQGLVQLALQVDLIRRQSQSPSTRFWDDATTQSHFWGHAIGLGLGIWLLVGSRGLIRMLETLRRPPAPEPPEPPAPDASQSPDETGL